MVWITGASDQTTALEGLKQLFPRLKGKDWDKTPYMPDYARILCFLSDRTLFEEVFALVSKHATERHKLDKSYGVTNALTRAFYDQFVMVDQVSEGKVGCGFKDGHDRIVIVNATQVPKDLRKSQSITLTGNAAGLFGAVLKHGYLFKDATGPSHGEYAHTLQWLVIAYAKFIGHLPLEHPVLDLYKNAAALPLSGDVATLDPENDLRITTKLPIWSFIADCFRSSERHGLPEDFATNLFVENYRSPSYLTDQMLHRRLSQTALGVHLQQHYAKRGFKTGQNQRSAVRDHYNYAGPAVGKTIALCNQVLAGLRDTVSASGTISNLSLPERVQQEDQAFFTDLKERTGKAEGEWFVL